jgi:chitinase
MRNINKFLIAVLLVTLISGCKKSSAKADDQPVATVKTPPGFRVVGYLRDGNVTDGSGAGIDYSKITHLNIAFINPDQDGNFTALAGLNTVVSAAHAKNVKVLVSIGGGSAPAYYSTLLADNKRADFVARLAVLVDDNNLDGIDVDLEGERVDNNYEAFVTALSASMKSRSKLLTAAIATAYKAQYTDAALAKFDFVNIMSYDKTGPWNPSNPGQHSPYDMAVSDLDYWANSRGIAKAKLSLGLPFYGYGFGTNAPSDMSFGDIVTQYPGSENNDQVTVNGGGIIYYNGIATIKSKTALALKKSGGVMIWQLLQDAKGDNSLLNTINVAISGAK